MLIDKHQADNIFRRVPGLTIKMDPELAALDKVLDDDDLFCLVRTDLARRYPQTESRGGKSTPVEVIVRMLVVKHLYNFSYEETEQHVADSLVLRQFCRVYFHTVPDHSTLCRWARMIQPAVQRAGPIAGRGRQADARSQVTYGRHGRGDEHPLPNRQQFAG